MGAQDAELGGRVPGYASTLDLVVLPPVEGDAPRDGEVPTQIEERVSSTVVAWACDAVSRWAVDEAGTPTADRGDWMPTVLDGGACLSAYRACPEDPSFVEHLEVGVRPVATGAQVTVVTSFTAAPAALANPGRVPAPSAPSLVLHLIPDGPLTDATSVGLFAQGAAVSPHPRVVDAETLQEYADRAEDPARTLSFLVISADGQGGWPVAPEEWARKVMGVAEVHVLLPEALSAAGALGVDEGLLPSPGGALIVAPPLLDDVEVMGSPRGRRLSGSSMVRLACTQLSTWSRQVRPALGLRGGEGMRRCRP